MYACHLCLQYTNPVLIYIQGFTSAYHDILNAAGPSYRLIFRHLLEYPTSPIIVHCTAGKDRTGVLVALIMKLAGVEDEVVAAEYQLTEAGLGPIKEEVVKHLLGNSAVAGSREKALSMTGARKEYMLGTLKMLQHDFGGVEAYLKKHCDLNDEELAKLRDTLTVEAAPVHFVDDC